MRVKRIGEVAMANTLSSHSIIRDCKHLVVPSFCYCKATLVSCSETATVRFRFTGTNSARQPPTLFAFLILLERWMWARVCSSWKEFALQAFCRFFANYKRKYCAFFNQGNAVFEGLIQKIKA